MDGSFVSTVGLQSELGLQALTAGIQTAGSNSFTGDLLTTLRTTSEPGPVCLGAEESLAEGFCAPVGPSSLMSTVAVAAVLSQTNRVSFTSRRMAAAAMVSAVTSRVRGVASPGVVAWLVSVSYVTGADMEELHGEEGQQESQEQLELLERDTLVIHPHLKIILQTFVDQCDTSVAHMR